MEQYTNHERMNALLEFRQKIKDSEADPSIYDKQGTESCLICMTDNVNIYDLYNSNNEPHGHGYCCMHCIHKSFLETKLGSEDIQVNDKCPICFTKDVSPSNLKRIIDDDKIVENYAIKIGEIIPTKELPWTKTWNDNFTFFINSMKNDFSKNDSEDHKSCCIMCPRCLQIEYIENYSFNCGYNIYHKCANKSKFMEEYFPSENENSNRYCMICSRPSYNSHYINEKPGDSKDNLAIRNKTDVNAPCGGKEEFLARMFAVRYCSFFNSNPNINVDECAKYSQLNFKKFLPRTKRFLQKYPRFESLCGTSHLSCNLKPKTKESPTKLKMFHRKMSKSKPKTKESPTKLKMSKSKRPWRGGSNKKTRKRRH